MGSLYLYSQYAVNMQYLCSRSFRTLLGVALNLPLPLGLGSVLHPPRRI